MIRVSVMYENKDGARFDHAYYALVRERLGGFGLIRAEVDRGMAGGGGARAPFVGVAHLYFNSVADFERGMKTHGKELMADVPNYTDVQPQVQISEIVA
jgi:uncharacterized protein (TIGR02118 family)